MDEILNRFFVFKLPIQAISGILQHSVESEISRTSTDNKKFIVKLPVGTTETPANYVVADEFNYDGIILELGNPEWQDDFVL